MPRAKKASLFVVSDGRGETAEQVVKAAAVQFEGNPYRIVRRAEVRSPEQVRRIMKKAAAERAVVFYTLVAHDTREALREASAEMLVPTVDLLGPVLSALHDTFKSAPTSKPGLLYASEREHFNLHEAIDYTLKHDDGQRPHELHKADVVLVGVSRAAKSSTCFYLAYEGVRAANVPLIPGVDPPDQLLELDSDRVVGLRINVMRLMTVREARASALGFDPDHDYLDKRKLGQEVLAANQAMDRHSWFSFDASYMAVEEVAREVMRARGIKSRRPR